MARKVKKGFLLLKYGIMWHLLIFLDESGSGYVSQNEEEFPDTSITVAHVSGET